MKTFLPRVAAHCLASLCLLLFVGQAGAQGVLQSTISKGSTLDAPRADTSSNYVDWWQVRTNPTVLVSVFGYNSGSQQWIQIFDSSSGPSLSVTCTASSDVFVLAGHGLTTGQRVQIGTGFGGVSAAIYYVNSVDTSTFYLYDTLAHAQTGGATGRQDVTSNAAGTVLLIPVHTFAIAATDNYSCIVPLSGISVGKGLVIANSTTGPLYTAGSKNVTMLVNYRNP